MSAFPNVNLVQAALFSSTGVTIQTGKKLVLAANATTPFEAVPFKQFDDKVTMLDASLNAVKTLITDVIQDASGSFNTLVELYQISKTIESTGVASLSAETSARVALDSRVFSISNMACSALVYADAEKPIPMPIAVIDTIDHDGWYFKNLAQGKKINWYTMPNATTVSQLKEINMILNIINPVSCPFVTLYTKFQGTDTTNYGIGKLNAASWYHAKYTYTVQTTLTKGKYNFRVSFDGLLTDNTIALDNSSPKKGSVQGYTNFDLKMAENSNITGNTHGLPVIPFLPTDFILAVSFGTDSGSSAGNVEFVLSGMNYYCEAGNQGLRFSNSVVMDRSVMSTLNPTV